MSTAPAQNLRPRRSVLYLPGSNARALEKARTVAADALILDLEDAVAPDAKSGARQQIADAVSAKSFGSREVIVRINGLATPWGEADLAAIAAAGPDAILIPKVETGGDILAAGHRLDTLATTRPIALWAMMETPAAIFNAESIARARRERDGSRFAALVMGTNDLAKETRARLVPGRRPCSPPCLCACWQPAATASTSSTACSPPSKTLRACAANASRDVI